MDKATLLARGNTEQEETRQVPIGDGAVTVRSLSRVAVKACKKLAGEDKDLFENLIISRALVDPPMSADEVAQWLDGAPAGDSVAVMRAINELSGLSEEAQKS